MLSVGYASIIPRMTELGPPTSAPRRIEDAIRESGTLIAALTPLDAAFAQDRADMWARVLLLLAGGILLFVYALYLERRRTRVH
jgi:hypothetical protein